MEPRLTSDFWVRAYLARLRLAGIPAYVLAHGDATAGAVLVVLATLDGRATVWQRSFDMATGARVWVVLTEATEVDVAALVARQRRVDPDLWVIEIEDRCGRTLLDEDGLR